MRNEVYISRTALLKFIMNVSSFAGSCAYVFLAN